MKVTAWSLAMYGYDRWAIKKDEEVRMNAFEIKCICHILMVSLTERDEKLVGVGDCWSGKDSIFVFIKLSY